MSDVERKVDLTPEDLTNYSILLRQVIKEARPSFVKEAKILDSSGVECIIVAPSIPYSPETSGRAAFDADSTPGLFGKQLASGVYIQPILGKLQVSNLDTVEDTRISYRSESEGRDFDILVVGQHVDVIGITPEEAYHAISSLVKNRSDVYGYFRPDPTRVSLGSSILIEKPATPLPQSEAPRQLPPTSK